MAAYLHGEKILLQMVICLSTYNVLVVARRVASKPVVVEDVTVVPLDAHGRLRVCNPSSVQRWMGQSCVAISPFPKSRQRGG